MADCAAAGAPQAAFRSSLTHVVQDFAVVEHARRDDPAQARPALFVIDALHLDLTKGRNP
jgi:hypothetical protein